MRLPDLNWPGTLFTDTEMPLSETEVEFHSTAVTKPNLWWDMLDSWMGKPVDSAAQGDAIGCGPDMAVA